MLISESQEDFVGVLLSWFFFMHVGWNPLSQFKGCTGRHITQKDKCTKLSNTFIDNYCPKKTTDPFSLTTELLYEGEIKNVEVEYDVILLFKLTTIYYLSSKMCPNAFFPFTKSVLQTTFVAKNYIIPCQKSPPKILNTSPTCVQNKMMCYCVFYNSCPNAGEV